MAENAEDARQWRELGRLRERLAEHEKGCETRHGALLERLARLEAKLDAANAGRRVSRELVAIVVSALAILAALFSGVWA